MIICVLLCGLLVKAEDCEEAPQSPIDIASPFKYLDPKIEFYFGYQTNAILYHDGNSLKVDGDFGTFKYQNSNFWAVDLVFKQPSEHTLDGVYLPMEMQVSFRDQYENLSVVVAFFSNSTESQFLNEVGFGNPQLKEATSGSLFKINTVLDLGGFLGYPVSYLYYTGTTTVTPCETNVTWIILTDTYKASPDQLENFPQNLYGNTREVQSKEGREIYTNVKEATYTEPEISSSDGENLMEDLTLGQTYKDVNDDFIIEYESYKEEFPTVDSIYSN